MATHYKCDVCGFIGDIYKSRKHFDTTFHFGRTALKPIKMLRCKVCALVCNAGAMKMHQEAKGHVGTTTRYVHREYSFKLDGINLRVCKKCGRGFVPSGLGLHQKRSGHRGWVELRVSDRDARLF